MYKTIIMPVDVFEMALSDKAVRHAEFLAQQDGVIHLLHVLPGSASFTMSRFTADLRRFEEHLQHEAETRLQTMVSHFSIDPSRIKPNLIQEQPAIEPASSTAFSEHSLYPILIEYHHLSYPIFYWFQLYQLVFC